MTIGNVRSQFLKLEQPFFLESGESLQGLTLAYETYGELNEDASNAILLIHALTGSHHAAGMNRAVEGVGDLWTEECHLGWWDAFIGSDKALDTDQFFVICVNYLGSCYGSSGPMSVNPETGERYGNLFPRITAWDVVASQLRVLDHLKIQRLHAVIGASLGGMLSMLLATRCPERVHHVVPMATGMETTILQKLLNFEQIIAIRNDRDFQDGDYDPEHPPKQGLALARMISHKTFVSLDDLERRARQEITPQKLIGNFYSLSHPVESYVQYQGEKFAQRFDANSYLRIMDLWQNFKLTETEAQFEACQDQRYLIFSINSDVCFYPEEQLRIVDALKAQNIDVTYLTVHSELGHDSFLLEPELYSPYLKFLLSGP
ncbi:MAG: homoserine O-acetyltransferase [Acaryochloridaceae cyanobacterium RL_2_7]|nr:homoserine O-acetyltransferase [Acaryochloridaceae cyanobacterium RL_2_7]